MAGPGRRKLAKAICCVCEMFKIAGRSVGRSGLVGGRDEYMYVHWLLIWLLVRWLDVVEGVVVPMNQ